MTRNILYWDIRLPRQRPRSALTTHADARSTTERARDARVFINTTPAIGSIDDVDRTVLGIDVDVADKMLAKRTTKHNVEFEGDDDDGARATATTTEIGVVDG